MAEVAPDPRRVSTGEFDISNEEGSEAAYGSHAEDGGPTIWLSDRSTKEEVMDQSHVQLLWSDTVEDRSTYFAMTEVLQENIHAEPEIRSSVRANECFHGKNERDGRSVQFSPSALIQCDKREAEIRAIAEDVASAVIQCGKREEEIRDC